MESFSEKEREQIKKFDQLRHLLQMMLMSHIVPVLIFFAVTLVASLVGLYVMASRSRYRYECSVIIHYTTTGRSDSTKSFSPKFVLALFNRSDVRQQFALKYRMKYGMAMCPCSINIEAIPDKKGVMDRFRISVKAPHERCAVRITNDFADTCLQTYFDEYEAMLNKQMDELQEKKEEALREKERLKRERQQLCADRGIRDPKAEYDQLRRSIPDAERKLKGEELQLEALELKYAELEAKMKAFNPALVSCEKELRRWLADRKKLDDEIERYRYEYTEANTKMVALRSRRDAMEAGFRKFLTERGISLQDTGHVDAAVLLHAEMEKQFVSLNRKRNQVRMLREAVAADKAKLTYLEDIMPQVEALNERLRTQDESLVRIQASISDIKARSVRDSMRLGERADSSQKIKPLGAKKIVLSIIISLLLTTLLSALIVTRDFLFGVVNSEKDFTFLAGIRYLGALPSREALFESKSQEQIAINTVLHAFQNYSGDNHVVLVSTLPGGKILPELFDAFERNYTMSGRRTLTIDLMLADNFNYDMPCEEDTGIVVHFGNKGVLPVMSKKFLSPSEIELLKSDLETLRKSYDLIFIRHSASMRRDRMFVEQIIPLCDSAMVAVGFRKTTRKYLRRLAGIGVKTGLPILVILSDNSPDTAGKHNNFEVGA